MMVFEDSAGTQWVLDSTDTRPIPGLSESRLPDRLFSSYQDLMNFESVLSYSQSGTTIYRSDIIRAGFQTHNVITEFVTSGFPDELSEFISTGDIGALSGRILRR